MEMILSLGEWKNLGIAVGIFLIFLVLRKLFTTYVFKLVLGFMQNKKIDFVAKILESFEKPLRWLFVIIGIQLALPYLPFELIAHDTERKIFRSLFIWLAAWGIYDLTSSTSLIFAHFVKRFDFQIDRIVIPFIEKMLRTIVVVLAASIIAEEWGFNVNGFIAGLGLGGLAFALAAKDTIGNLFGGIVIVTEKPFTIGDWIKTPSVEGIVEDITFRSTKVRTFAQALVTVPNATLSNEPIINWSKMGKRQVAFHLGVTYNTSREKLETVVNRIRQMLMDDEEIHNETILVSFDRFNESSLDIYLYFFTNTIAFNDYLKVKETVNFKIMEIFEEEGVEFAFPTRTLVIDKQGEAVKEEELFEKARG
ncbi:mechanosensitive ion channel family protein [Bacillus songklensis]|uniref:Mechanosensitive ion channel family protein n=1 Tax=Bacillus songklensis TaxID=1069116 RepID=A0ABV8B7J3_9BACI